jgi:uncharacterized Ntn-hydrolase superfamily protein
MVSMPNASRRPLLAALVLSGFLAGPLSSALIAQSQPGSYAIVARDPVTGNYGVAAASNAPLIGMNLEFFDPDVGAVVSLGGPFLDVNERVLIALGDGLPPGRAISVGLVGDEEAERQVLAISPTGAAVFTGDQLEDYAGDVVGDFFVAAGFRLAGRDVVLAMEEAFVSTDAPLADRLLAALAAGRDAGGEKDGARSAALLIVGPGARFATRNRLLDLRVDFVPEDAVGALSALKADVEEFYGIN